jgi:hypothetical protein
MFTTICTSIEATVNVRLAEPASEDVLIRGRLAGRFDEVPPADAFVLLQPPLAAGAEEAEQLLQEDANLVLRHSE